MSGCHPVDPSLVDPSLADPSLAVEPEVLTPFVENHRAFVDYVQRRVGSRALAEELVQDAFVRRLQQEGSPDSTVAWFYRVLHNAAIDHLRREKSRSKGLELFAAEVAEQPRPEEEAAQVACACIERLARTLKPEFAEALQKVEVEGMSVKDYALTSGISASNAGVRIFRARDALRQAVTRSCRTCAVHGCFDCTCEPS